MSYNLAKDYEVMVFGGNRASRHGAGAARYALENKGAIYGGKEGLQGMSYCLPTKGYSIEQLTLPEIKQHVDKFIEFAKQHPEMKFFVTRVGCGLAGWTSEDIAPMFVDAPSNCRFEDDWSDIISFYRVVREW